MSFGAILLALTSNVVPSLPANPSVCSLSTSDQSWLDQSITAWDYAAGKLSGIGRVKRIEAIIFDNRCSLTSKTAMNGGARRWTGVPNQGKVKLPTGETVPVGVTSFSQSVGPNAYFVMSTPSVWRAAGKNGKGAPLETLMTAVMLHEGTHVAQMPTYGAAIGRIAKLNHLPESFSDDSIQDEFGSNSAFAASVEAEARLLNAASTARTRAHAAALVRQARGLMKARYQRWFAGTHAYLAQAEPLWLSLEGSGQWLAYSWEIDPRGGRANRTAVLPGFLNDKYWTQREGFAAFMALDRLVGTAWKQQAFRGGRKTVIEMLDEAAGSAPTRRSSSRQ